MKNVCVPSTDEYLKYESSHGCWTFAWATWSAPILLAVRSTYLMRSKTLRMVQHISVQIVPDPYSESRTVRTEHFILAHGGRSPH